MSEQRSTPYRELLKSLRQYNTPDRTIDYQRQCSIDIHAAADAIEDLLARIERSENARRSDFDDLTPHLSDAEKVWRCRACGVEQDSSGPLTAPSANARWIACSERLPADETPVLILRNGEARIAELRWEHPTWEETFKAFRYWDDPLDDGQAWEWDEITHWQPLPNPPDRGASK